MGADGNAAQESSAPVHPDEILIGYFGPDDPAHPHGGDMWRAAQWAVEEANRRGGYRGKPFRLICGWSDNPWGTGVVKVTRMAYTDRVWAIIGGIDGPSTHLAEQVVAKARLPLLGPASTDRSVNLAHVPWMFSLVPGDHLQAPVLAEAIAARTEGKPFLLISADDHDSHLFTVELRKSLAKRRMVPRFHFEYQRASREIGELTARIKGAKADSAVLIAGARDSARLVVSLRDRGFENVIFGGPGMGRRAFRQEAGAAAEGVVFPLLYEPKKESREFAKAFREHFAMSPDYAAAHAYDAVQLVIAAIGTAGLDRAGIRDALGELSPWTGVTGTVNWDRTGGNTRAVHLGTIRDGRIVRLSEPDRAPAAAPTGATPASPSPP